MNQTFKTLLTPFVRTVDSRDAARKSNLCTTPLALKSSMDFFRSGDETSMAKPDGNYFVCSKMIKNALKNMKN